MNKQNILVPLLVFVGICFFWIFGISIVDIFYHYNKELVDTKKLGEIGDIYGVINTFFSGLAFAGIIITVLLQKAELIEQRKELRLTREEFQMNRVTNIVYKQIERIDNTINMLEFKHGTTNIRGIPGLVAANETIRTMNVNGTQSVSVQFIQNSTNDQSLSTLSQVIYDSSVLLREIIEAHDVNPELRAGLKELFTKNISEVIREYSNHCRRVSEQYLGNAKARSHNHNAQVNASNRMIAASDRINQAFRLLSTD